MTDEAWNADFVRSIGMMLWGHAIEEVDEHGEVIVGDTLLILLNAHSDEVPFTLPRLEDDHHWQRIFDTTESSCSDNPFAAGERYPLGGRSVAVLKVASSRDRRRGRHAAASPAAA
jgi:glycogen operon protein